MRVSATDYDGAAIGEIELRVHPASRCAGREIPCCIHSPSDHALVDFPLNWRADIGVMERICAHGVGHPDPDHMAYVLSENPRTGWQAVHGCDGCCIEEAPDEA